VIVLKSLPVVRQPFQADISKRVRQPFQADIAKREVSLERLTYFLSGQFLNKIVSVYPEYCLK
jgi:hypothetical protein